jgi:hypothetical protein
VTKLTSLEKDIIDAILSGVIQPESARLSAINALEVRERRFSSSDNRSCVGFYTHFEDNTLLAPLTSVSSRFTADAVHPDLPNRMAGFILFCSEKKGAIELLECYLYGDDSLPISEFLLERHRFTICPASDS